MGYLSADKTEASARAALWSWCAADGVLVIRADPGGPLAKLDGSWTLQALLDQLDGLARVRIGTPLRQGRAGDPIDIRVTLVDGRPAHFFGAFHDVGVARGLIVPAETGERMVHGESNVEPVFQPIRRLSTLEVAGFEALARFRAPDGRLVGPDTRRLGIVIGWRSMPRSSPTPSCSPAPRPAFGAEPNSHVSLVDAAMPGMLPVINEFCVEQAVRTGLGLKAQINLTLGLRPQELFLSRPAAGLSDQPVPPDRGRGRGDRRLPTAGRAIEVGIERCIWSRTPASRSTTMDPKMSFVDLNRSGVALMEIVSRPTCARPKRRRPMSPSCADPALSGHLRRQHGEGQPARRRERLGLVRKPGDFGHLGTRCEIKNVNSIRFIQAAIDYEARRQIAISKTAARSCRKPACTTPTRARPARCAPRKRRMTTAISPIPTCCRWSSTGLGRRLKAPACPNCRTTRRRASCAPTACRPMTPGVLVAEGENRPIISRRGRQGPRRQERGQLGHQRAVRPLNKAGLDRGNPVSAAQLGGIIDLIKERHDLGKIAKDLFEIVWTEGGDPARSSKRAA
jgi:aspartyl-tRNA(Asn)/glutamyl-tRNA(Gln) amidotransferase subunit B